MGQYKNINYLLLNNGSLMCLNNPVMASNQVFIYCIGNQDSKQKIGFSHDVQQRLKTLQTANGEKLSIHYQFPVPSKYARKVEAYIHNQYRHKKLVGEWFQMSKEEAVLLLQYEEMMLESTITKF